MIIENIGWKNQLGSEFQKDYYIRLWEKLDVAYDDHNVFPPKTQVFSAFELVDFDDVKVVILGQDPYHAVGQAHGLSFSVEKGTKIPPSLRNIFKELQNDLGIGKPENGCLMPWAVQGILMLNAVLTVDEGKAGSHKKIGWHRFTDEVIKKLNRRDKGVIFVLWGNFAISKKVLITNPQHRIIESVHPSPLSANRGFFGSQPFSKINAYLKEMGNEPIDWRLKSDESQMMLDI